MICLPTITRITTDHEIKNRYHIYINDGSGEQYGFSLDEDLLVQYHLYKGLHLTEEMISQLTFEDAIQKIYHQVIRYLSYRMRTEKEIRDYLQQKNVDESIIERMIDRLTNERLINDEEFANMFVRSRMRTSTKGPNLIKQELMVKGVDSQKASQALQQFTYDEQLKRAQKIVHKRLRKSSKHSFQKQLYQTKAALERNGYEADVIRTVIDEATSLMDYKKEWHAIKHQGEKLSRKLQAKNSEADFHQKMKEGLYRKGFTIDMIQQYLKERGDHNEKYSL